MKDAINPRILETLVEHAARINEGEPYQAKADVLKINESEKNAWAAFLLSIATTESIEESIISPLLKTFAGDALVERCIDYHARDERRHHSLLSEYVQKTFSREKKTRTASDILVYDTLLPKITSALALRPACLLGILYFYEIFSVDFYKVLKSRAHAHDLPGLFDLLQTLEKDELRHLACLQALMDRLPARSLAGRISDAAFLRSTLELLLIDINPSRWAYHNRHVRKNVLTLGMDPIKMSTDARKSARRALQFINERERVA